MGNRIVFNKTGELPSPPKRSSKMYRKDRSQYMLRDVAQKTYKDAKQFWVEKLITKCIDQYTGQDGRYLNKSSKSLKHSPNFQQYEINNKFMNLDLKLNCDKLPVRKIIT